MGRMRALLWGALLSLSMVSSMQALVFDAELEYPLAPGVDLIISKDPGLKLGLPFMGGTAKQRVTIGSLYKDSKWALEISSRAVVNDFLGGIPQRYTFSDKVGKQVTSVIAACWRRPQLKKKLKEFYDIKQQLNGVKTKEEKIVLQKKCIVVKHTIKVLMA